MAENNNPTVSNGSKSSHATTSRHRYLADIVSLRIVRLGLGGCGIFFLAWAFIDSGFRDVEGSLRGTICLPLGVGLALLIFGWAAASRFRVFAFWFALALVGQAAALQLIDAGPSLHYQHYKPIDRALETSLGPLLLLLVQAVIVLIGLRGRWQKITVWVRSSFKVWQLVGIGLVLVFSSVAVQRDPSLYLQEQILAIFVQVVNLGNIVALVWVLPTDALVGFKERFERLLGGGNQEDAQPKGADRFVVIVAAWVIVLASVLALAAYESHPHVTDEVAYLYHARFLANGTLTLPAPPVPAAFDIYLMEIKGDQWYPATLPGWPAMLSVGVWLGVPWLVNPILAGLNILLANVLLRDLYDRFTAHLAVLLLAVSPWYVFMAINLMPHTFNLTCVLVAAVAVIWARKTGQLRWGWVAGAVVGFTALIRPVDGLIACALIGFWVIGIGGRRLSIQSILAFSIGVMMSGAITLLYNQVLSGNPMVFPLNAYLDSHFGVGKNDLGFGPRGFGWPVQPFPDHTPIAAIINASLNAFSINTELLGWSIGSLWFVSLMIFSNSLRKSDKLMLAVCAAIFIPYFFYYFSGGPDFGARYWFLMLVPLVALTIQGFRLFQKKLELGASGSSAVGTRVMVAAATLSLLALINYFPWRAMDKYHNFWGMRPDVVNLAREYSFGKSLVLIKGNESHPDFTSAAIYNPLDWNADAPVYAWDRTDAVRAQLLNAFANRPVWIIEAPSITHAGYKVVAGPLSAQELAKR